MYVQFLRLRITDGDFAWAARRFVRQRRWVIACAMKTLRYFICHPYVIKRIHRQISWVTLITTGVFFLLELILGVLTNEIGSGWPLRFWLPDLLKLLRIFSLPKVPASSLIFRNIFMKSLDSNCLGNFIHVSKFRKNLSVSFDFIQVLVYRILCLTPIAPAPEESRALHATGYLYTYDLIRTYNNLSNEFFGAPLRWGGAPVE